MLRRSIISAAPVATLSAALPASAQIAKTYRIGWNEVIE